MQPTKIVPNHIQGEYDVRWSILTKLGVWIAGMFATVLAASAIASAALALTTVRKLDVMEERQKVSTESINSMKGEIAQLRNQIARQDFLSRTEFRDWLKSPDRTYAIRAIMSGKPEREVD